MLFTSFLLSLVLAIQAVSARVASISTIGNSDFSAHARKNPHYVHNGTAALLHVYSKYNLSSPRNGSPAFKAELNDSQSTQIKRQDGTTSVPYLYGLYYVSTEIGGQFQNMIFDTASADLWVNSKIPGRYGFNPDFSATFKNLKGASWVIVTADGSYARGTVGTDIVRVAGLTVTNQAVELAVEVTTGLDNGLRFTGVVGLAFNSLNQVRPKAQNTFFDNAKASLSSPLFAAYLPPQVDGNFDFGVLNTSRYTGSITYTPISSPNIFWKVPSSTFKVNSTTYPLLDDTTAIIDTASSLIMMPDTACTTYYSQVPGSTHIPGSNGWYFPCTTTLPDLSVAIGDAYATIPGSLINFSHDDSNTTCFGGLQCFGCPAGRSCARQVSVYGQVFLNANYAVFDTQGPRFGFAPLVPPWPVAPEEPETDCAVTATCVNN